MVGGHEMSTGTQLRIAIAVVVVLVNVVYDSALLVLPWAMLVVAADLAADLVLAKGPFSVGDRRSAAFVLTLIGIFLAGLAMTAGPGSLPLLIIPFFRVGEQWGRRYVLACGQVYLAAIASALFVAESNMRVHLSGSSMLIWSALALSLALLVAWSARLHETTPASSAAAAEATLLLSRLLGLAGELRGGFDPATSAEHLLDAAGRPGPMARTAVLVGSSSDRPVPLALRGCERVPWPDPTSDAGVIGIAWRAGQPGTSWDADTHREIHAVPLRSSSGAQIGVLVQDIMAPVPSPTEDVVGPLVDVTEQFGPVLGVALAFANLRERAGFEERERLAREMHDGLAQELVALSLHLDRIRRADAGASGTGTELELASAQLRRILGDLRSHISDLRVSVRPERGLGATMSSRLQSFGTTTGLVVSLRLNESGFRLPAIAETALYQLFLDVLADVKHSGATGVDIDLTVGAPSATLRMRHNGRTALTQESMLQHPITLLGGEISVATGEELDLRVELLAPTHSTPVHVKQKVPQPS